MNRVASRSTIAMMLVVVLLGGMCLFLTEYVMKADDWVVFEGSPHIYSGVNLGRGVVTDRSGELLLSAGEERVYSEDKAIRKSTLHWLGDRLGYISAPAVAGYAEEMSGYGLLNGLYGYSGTGGEAVLTISAEVQKVALEALGKKKGTVAVYNYKTGEILCAVTTPTYDPDNVPDIDEDSEKSEGIYLNRFTQVSYVPDRSLRSSPLRRHWTLWKTPRSFSSGARVPMIWTAAGSSAAASMARSIWSRRSGSPATAISPS